LLYYTRLKYDYREALFGRRESCGIIFEFLCLQ